MRAKYYFAYKPITSPVLGRPSLQAYGQSAANRGTHSSTADTHGGASVGSSSVNNAVRGLTLVVQGDGRDTYYENRSDTYLVICW
jgi:hypothetical protein